MELIIDIPDEEYNRIKEWGDNITGYQTSLVLYRAVRNGTPYNPTMEKPFLAVCRDASLEQNLPLYFAYYEETGILEVYLTKTNELFEKRRCSKHTSNAKFKEIVDYYLYQYYPSWAVQNEKSD